MNTAKITPTDRAAIVRDAWRRAYGFAIAAGEPVRLHLGEAFRAAWAAFRQARAEGVVVPEQTAEYEEQYGRSDRAEARAYLAAMLVEKAAAAAQAVEDYWSTFGPAAGVSLNDEDDLGCDLDDGAESPAAPVQLDIVAWLAAQPAMVPQQAQQQQAQAVSPEVARLREQERDLTWDVEHLEALARERFEHGSDHGQLDAVARMEAKWDEREEVRAEIRSLESAIVSQPVQQQQAQAAAPGPDLMTAEGLAQVLVGRTAKLALQMGEPDYTVTGVSRWTSPDGSRVRDYIALETTGMWNDDRNGPVGIFIDRAGGGRGGKLETKAGTARWGYGVFCNSGNKQYNADGLIKELLAPIMDD